MKNPRKRSSHAPVLAGALIPLILLFGGAIAQTASAPARAATGPIPATEKLLDQQALKEKLVGKYLYPTKPSAADASLNEFFFEDGRWKLTSDRYSFEGDYTVLSNSYCVKRPGNALCFAVTSDQNNVYRLYGVGANNSYSPMFEVTFSDTFHGVKGPPPAATTQPRP